MNMRYYKILLALLFGAATADPPCKRSPNPPKRPGCTDTCLKAGDVQGICLDNLRGICEADVTKEYFGRYSNCFLDECQDNEDLYNFLDTFKKECDAAKKPLTEIDGQLGDFLTRPDGGDKKTSISTSTWNSEDSTAERTSDKTTKTNDAVTISLPPKWSAPVTSETHPNTETRTPTPTPQPGPSPTPAPPPQIPDSPQTSALNMSPASTVTTPTPTSAPIPSTKPNSNPTLNTVQVASIIGGGIAGIAIMIGVALFLVLRRRKRATTFPEPTLPELVPGNNYTNDRFGNVHTSEWMGAPQYGGGVRPVVGAGDPQGGFAQRAFMNRNAGLGTNF